MTVELWPVWALVAAWFAWWAVGSALFGLHTYLQFRYLTVGDLWLAFAMGFGGPFNLIVLLLFVFIDFCAKRGNRRIL